MKSKIVQIGNSRGVRLPKTLLEQAGIGEDIELEAKRDSIVIRSAHRRRDGWDEAFKLMSLEGADKLLDMEKSSKWDENEWNWK